MAIESLKPAKDGRFRHHAGHDLECLLNTMLTICHYTEGPVGQLRQAKEEDKDISLNKWFVLENPLSLAKEKSITLEAFDLLILPHLPAYWQDFAPFLQRLIQATYSGMPYLMADNISTHKAYRKILNGALDKYTKEEEGRYSVYASVPLLGKRPSDEQLPGHSSCKKPRREGGDATPSVQSDAAPHFLESYRVQMNNYAVDQVLTA